VSLGFGWLALLVPGWLLMAQVTRTDDRAFRILWLWGQTKLANRARLTARFAFHDLWGASTYATLDRRVRSWEGRWSRWAG
jgi:type IV secretion system protein VirB3